jgi:hexosaminidase
MRRLHGVVMLTVSVVALRASLATAQTPPAIVPRPAQVAVGEGQFVIDATTVISADAQARDEADQLAAALQPALGRSLKVAAMAGDDQGISLRLDKNAADLGPEGYRLEVMPKRIEIRAAQPAGLFYAGQTLRQLLPAAVYQARPAAGVRWSVPCVRITDRPRFAWRGLLLDPARHFMPKEYVKQLIAAMAAHKLNTLQLHLTDDQGWRLEIKKYPRLTEVGAWRSETLVGHYRDKPWRFDGRRHGGFYSQADIRELVTFARRHHVNLVPEIEMPGHAGAALVAYPELSCFPDRPRQVWTRWGINPDIFNPTDRTIAFLQDVLAEVTEMFPSPFIHVGGDEAIKDYWKESPAVQQRIRQLGLKNEEELQGWFIRQMDKFLTSRGRRLIGWDEILQGGLAPGATVMSWRGTQGAVEAARLGHDVVMAANQWTYFDYYQGPQEREPLAIGGMLPLEKAFRFEPITEGVTAQQCRHILGAQGQLWTEYIATPRAADYMLWPRAVALAEVVWSPAAGKDYDEFLKRLRVHLARLAAMGVTYRPLD